MQMKKFVSLFTASSLALMLAACGGGGGETNTAPVETNVEGMGTMDNGMENMAMPEPTPSATVTPVPAPEPKAFDETVTEDDAAATGMTSRVDRGGNESQPAQ